MIWNRQSVLQGKDFLGTWLNLGVPASAEIAGLAGFDWVLIDREHGSGDEKDTAMQIMAAQCGGAASIVRVSGIYANEIKRVLDWGPSGLMVPSIHTAEQAREAIDAIRIPPFGNRGAASSTRASGYGFGYEKYLQDANSNLVTMLQIESTESVRNCSEIASIDGADVLFIGPTDLSIDMGVKISSDEFNQALNKVLEAAQQHQKAAGILARNPEQARKYRSIGFRMIALESDRGLLSKGFSQAVAAYRQ